MLGTYISRRRGSQCLWVERGATFKSPEWAPRRQAVLTFPAGLYQSVPLPTAVAQQGEGCLSTAWNGAWCTHIQQLVPHLQAGATLEDGVWEGWWVSTRPL